MTDIQGTAVENEQRGRKQGRWSLRNLKELFVGAKDYFFGVDKRGMWLGAQNYEEAPFRVNMKGEIEAATLDTDVVTARSVVTSDSGQRVEIQDATNTVRFYNSADDLVLQFMGVTDYTESQVNITGGIQLKADEDINYDAGIRMVPLGSGSSIAAVFEAFNREKDNDERAYLMVISNGQLVFVNPDNEFVMNVDSSGGMFLGGEANTAEAFFEVFSDGNIRVNIPTTDPEIEGLLWNDGGTVKVSAG